MTDPVVAALKTAATSEVAAVETSILTKIGASLAANPYKTLGLSGAAGAVIGFAVKAFVL